MAESSIILLTKKKIGRRHKWVPLPSTTEVARAQLYELVNKSMVDQEGQTLFRKQIMGRGGFDQNAIGNFIADQQIICFQENAVSENKKRLIGNIFGGGGDTVALVVGWNVGADRVIGSATIQKGDHGNGVKYWINEVCKTPIDKVRGVKSPISDVMKVCEDWISNQGMANAWLMVEKNPDHGFGAVLNWYYGQKKYALVASGIGDYQAFTIMKKNLKDSPDDALWVDNREYGIRQTMVTDLKDEAKAEVKGFSTKKLTPYDIHTVRKKYIDFVNTLPQFTAAIQGGGRKQTRKIRRRRIKRTRKRRRKRKSRRTSRKHKR